MMSLHDRIGGRASLRRVQVENAEPTLITNELGGYEVDTPLGSFYNIELPALEAKPMPARPGPALHLWQRIELVYGIGPTTAIRLRSEGYGDLRELTRHSRWGKSAALLVKAIEQADLATLRSSGARESELACYFGIDDFMVVDIETTGLARALPLFLIGIAWWEKGYWRRRQLFARTFAEEPAVLSMAAKILAEKPALVSYNGRAFDEPYVKARLAVHHMKPPGFLIHYDVFQEARRLAGLPNRRLPTVVEHMLGEVREEDTPGSLAPELYFAFVQDPKPEIIKPVLEHNARDIADLCHLFEVARQAAYGSGDSRWEQAQSSPSAM